MRLPLVPSLVVAAAIATMIALGVWQLRRADWKEGLIATYHRNEKLPAIAWPGAGGRDQSLLYRRTEGFCLQPSGWRAVAGRNRADEPGWAHIASCRTGGLEGPGMEVELGWSKAPQPPQWRGGAVSGVIAPDREHGIRLVSDKAPPGLQPLKPPSPEETPNNHLFYAIQWFFFAAAAAVIYLLALRRRQARELPPGAESTTSAPQ
ncbi:MAG TPA: SURF1 family cytochrome oxidase biogenesis protein [Allosphingosinicella sp.]|jgi:cytochrome oxidase assembly protein ShyY1